MLPGSCVGAICGFATQRYGTLKSSRVAASIAVIFLLVGLNAHAGAPKSLVTLHGAKNTPYVQDAELVLESAGSLETQMERQVARR